MAILVLAEAATGCGLDTRPAPTGLAVEITAPIPIPAGRAHAVLQEGRLAGAANQLEPYCELEVRTPSGADPRWIEGGRFRVSRISSRVLVDPVTDIPALFALTSCSEPLFQELVWWLSSTAPSDVLLLRCIAPYYHCAFGPPLSPDQVRQQVRGYLDVRVDQGAGPSLGEAAATPTTSVEAGTSRPGPARGSPRPSAPRATEAPVGVSSAVGPPATDRASGRVEGG